MYSGQGYVRILKQLLFSYFINILVFLIAPFSTIVLSRGLSVEDFGVYSLFFTFWNVGLHFGSGGLYLFMQNYLPGRNFSEQKSVAASFFQFIFLFIGGGVFLWWLFLSDWALAWLNIEGYFGSFFLVLFAVLVSALATVPQTWICVNQKLEFGNFLYGVNSTLWIILSGLEFLIFSEVVIWHIFVYWILGCLLQVFLSFWYIGGESFSLFNFFNFKMSVVGKGLYFGLFALPLVIGPWLFSTVDRLLLSHYVGQDVIGFYSVAFALVNIVSSFGGIVSGIFYPYISKAHNVNNVEKCVFLWNAALKYTLLVVLPGIVGMYVLRKELITLIASSKFLGALSLMPYFVFIPFFASLVFLFQMLLLINGKPIRVGLIYVLTVVFNGVLNSQLIPLLGVDGAAITIFLTNFLMVFCMVLATRKYLHFKWGFIKFFRISASALFMGFVLFFFNPVDFLMKLGVILFGCFIYFVSVIFLKVLGSDELLVVKSLMKDSVLKRIFFWF